MLLDRFDSCVRRAGARVVAWRCHSLRDWRKATHCSRINFLELCTGHESVVMNI